MSTYHTLAGITYQLLKSACVTKVRTTV